MEHATLLTLSGTENAVCETQCARCRYTCQYNKLARRKPHMIVRTMLLIFENKFIVNRDSSVSIANRYGLDGLGIESLWGRDFPHLSRPALGPTQPPIQWVPGLSRG